MAIKYLCPVNKKYTNIIHLADIHCPLLKKNDEFRLVFDKLYQKISETPESTLIVIVGDLLHNKSTLSPESVLLAKDFLHTCSNLRTTVLCAGNHDGTLSNKDRLDSLTPIVEALNSPSLLYLKKSGLYGIGNILFNNYSVFDPVEEYINGKDIPTAYRNEYECVIALYHGMVSGANTDLGYTFEDKTKSVEMFDYHDIALLGDIHRPQTLQEYDRRNDKPCVRFCGSLIQQNHGEPLTGHGYSYWDIESRSFEHVEIQNDFGYFTIDIEKGEIKTNLDSVPNRARLRIRYKDTELSAIKQIESSIKSKIDIVESSYEITDDLTVSSSKNINIVGNDITLSDVTNIDVQNKLIENYVTDKLKITDVAVLNSVLDINKKVNGIIKKEEVVRNVRWKPIKLEWSNMFRYGENNVISFDKLKGLVGIFGGNRIGKSSIQEVLSFVIWDKYSKDSKAINVLNSKKTSFRCKFNFQINGIDYFIERKGKLNKDGGVKVDVKFWKEENGATIELNGEARRNTNAVIEEYVGTYDDFILTTLSVQGGKNNNSFIDVGDSERKDLLARFMGVNIFDKLHDAANERCKELVKALKIYRQEDYTTKLNNYQQSLLVSSDNLKKAKNDINLATVELDAVRDKILLETGKKLPSPLLVSINLENETRKQVDLDKNIKITVTSISSVDENIATTRNKIKEIDSKLSELESKKVTDTYSEYTQYINELRSLKNTIESKKIEMRSKLEKVTKLKSYSFDSECEYCVKNAGVTITDGENAKKELEQDKIILDGFHTEYTLLESKSKSIEWSVNSYSEYNKLKNDRIRAGDLLNTQVNDENKLKSKLSSLEDQLKVTTSNINSYNINRETIEFNSKIEAEIANLQKQQTNISFKLKNLNSAAMEFNGKVVLLTSQIEETKQNVKKVLVLEQEYKSHEIYLKCVCRDGIPYEIVTLIVPKIQQLTNEILSRITPFRAKFECDGKNVIPYITDNDTKWSMLLASGFEKFILSLAIRIALIRISNLPSMNCCIIDEGMGALESTNLSSMKMVFEFIKTNFDFVIVISHLTQIHDMIDNEIEISDEDGFSKVFHCTF